MKLSEAIKKLFGGNADIEIDMPDNGGVGGDAIAEAVRKAVEEAMKSSGSNKLSADDITSAVKKVVDEAIKGITSQTPKSILEEGWYNKETGAIDESKVKDASVLEAVKMLNGIINTNKQSVIREKALENVLKGYKLGVKKETIMKHLDLKDVKYDSDKTAEEGIKAALEKLKKEEPGFFKDKGKTPLEEGYNPVEKKNTGEPSSFMEAFEMTEEISE